MEKKVINRIKQICTPLIVPGVVKACWIFGSSVKKKKGNDIDVLILYDEKAKNLRKSLMSIDSKVEKLMRKEKLPLHFQRPISLSLFWSLLIKGEPWVFTLVKEAIAIHDSSNYLELMKKLIKKKHALGEEIKAERLVARSGELLTDNRELRVMTIEELFLAASEAAQIFLISKNKIVFEPRKILKEILKYMNVSIYFDILNLYEKSNKGVLSDFTGEDIDYYTFKIKNFIQQLEELSKKGLENYSKNKSESVLQDKKRSRN